MSKNITPLEKATEIIISSPNDIIFEWEGTSKLIYCYKNNKDLIEWASLLSDELIEYCSEKSSFFNFDDHIAQDFMHIGLYLNMMKVNNWAISVHEKDMIRTINIILASLIPAESINRITKKQIGANYLPGSGNFIDMKCVKKNKYNIASYAIHMNSQVNIKKE